MSVFHSDFSKFWWFGPQGLAGLAGRSVGSCDRQRLDFDRLNFDTRGSDAISLGGEEEKKNLHYFYYYCFLYPLDSYLSHPCCQEPRKSVWKEKEETLKATG